MRAVVQRVSRASSTPGGSIGHGLCVLVGIGEGDDEPTAVRLADRIARLRIFENEEGKFDRSLLDTGGEALVVSQFTLLADTAVVQAFRDLGIRVETGTFGARMTVELVNDGPVTIVLE